MVNHCAVGGCNNRQGRDTSSRRCKASKKHGIKELTGPTMTLGGWKPIESAATTSETVTTKRRTGSTTKKQAQGISQVLAWGWMTIDIYWCYIYWWRFRLLLGLFGATTEAGITAPLPQGTATKAKEAYEGGDWGQAERLSCPRLPQAAGWLSGRPNPIWPYHPRGIYWMPHWRTVWPKAR